MNNLICHRCKRPIADDMAYVLVHGDIVLRMSGKKPMVFSCMEQAHNYAQKLIVHDVCWIEMLKEYGVQLYDMDKVAEAYRNKEAGNGVGQN
ncbi:MAG: hypothetical protein ABH952_02025 [Candidatus Omnitrophota bacterium]